MEIKASDGNKSAPLDALRNCLCSSQTRHFSFAKQRIEARKRAVDAKKKRGEDTSRKGLVGAVLLAKVKRPEWPKDRLLSKLTGHLTRDDDCVLLWPANEGITLLAITREDTRAAPIVDDSACVRAAHCRLR